MSNLQGTEYEEPPPRPTTAVERWGDVAMYRAPVLDGSLSEGLASPVATVVSMTADPLRVMAAASELYRGVVHRDPSEVPQEVALAWLHEMTQTKIQSALEYVDIHLLIENVSRGFTHQLVRQRVGASYIQESMRFAVKESAVMEVMMPPSIKRLAADHPDRVVWQDTVARVSWAYNALVNDGIPAEDARGLLPTNIGTRVHYKTTLRGLAEHSGLRLCSQAQNEWKLVWRSIIQAILAYGPETERWQQRAIVRLFRPICYMTGKCEFMGANDRYCAIRSRVEEHHRHGDTPDTWTDIDPTEPLHAMAARDPAWEAQR
jgi:flavin-dependent thymidylate synthase